MAAPIDIASLLRIPVWLFVVITVWEGVWTALAMWRAAKLRHVVWFIVFFLINLFGIPEIVYLVVTGKKSRNRR